MNIENLEKANALLIKIKAKKEEIKYLIGMRTKDTSKFGYYIAGQKDGCVGIPKHLCEKIAWIIQEEFTKEIEELEKKFEAL